MSGTKPSAMRAAILAFIIAALPNVALAYVGPGAGISALGALWGLILGVVMAVGVVLFWPIRMLLRKRKAAAEAKQEEAKAERQQESDDDTDSSTGG